LIRVNRIFPFYFKNLYKSIAYTSLAFFTVIYYLASILNTGSYVSNLRIFEMFFMASLMPLVLIDLTIFKRIIVGLSFTSIILIQVIVSLGADRLMINKDDFAGLEIGGSNPIGFGLPIAFCIFTIIAYGSKIKFRFNIHRVVLLSLLSISLIISTSRGSILVVFVLLCVYYFSKYDIVSFLKIIFVPLIFYFSIILFKNVDKNFSFAHEFLVERSSDKSKDFNSLSSGRSEQWDAVFSHLSNYPLDLIFGFGPGTQIEAHQVISYSTQNKIQARLIGLKMAYHALFLQLIVEIGLIGVFLFYTIILLLILKSIDYFKSKSDIYPFLGILGFVIIGLSVSSFDPFSGLFLGLAFIPLISKNKSYVRIIKQDNIVNSPSFR
jgi:O-antigen ligase